MAACFLDATKAFECLRFDKLFSILLDRNVSDIDLCSLMDLYYPNRYMNILERAALGLLSLCIYGIHQGAIASPVLYCVYMDVL